MEKWLVGLANNLLLRELGVGALILLTIVVYYFRYVHLARRLHGRAQQNGLTRLIAGTRTVMVGLVFVLLLVIGYDRVWPHFAPQAQATAQTDKASGSEKKAAGDKATTNKTATGKADSGEKAAGTKTAAKGGSADAATSSSDSSAESSSSAVTETAETQAAETLVSDYYAKNPSALDTTAQVTYRYLGDTTGNANIPVHRIGGFVTENGKEVQKYEFWVYPGNQFDREDNF
ncbi:hypothetical protein [Lacticaseibacillus kribbianus]|uniref:hypothetical protein n=1 Tax=Lacticaseibacillus kribbianus TaxID=2926292 RepID=UPI001CD533B3|nr:hypothetical protein [Lacticaseibacillus kribbianus]